LLKEQLTRKPYKFPKLIIKDNGQKRVEDFTYDDFKLEDYNCHTIIKMKMS
jgi:thymidylate synthase